MSDQDKTSKPTFETEALRLELKSFLDTPCSDAGFSESGSIGGFKFGVYAFFDFDGEPIYVGQTNELLRTRIRRHLTNQRTDAVAMSVLDPFEVLDIEVWPLPGFEGRDSRDAEARKYLNALEATIYQRAVDQSHFGAVLNEKPPPPADFEVTPGPSYRGRIVSEEVFRIRAHPDYRIARRSQVIARLAQIISERKVQSGLRRTLLVQARRLEWLAARRL